MTRPALTLPPKVKTLAQQNADFTAEGAPPPGKAGMSIPDRGHESVKAVSPTRIIVPGAHTHRPSDKNRCQGRCETILKEGRGMLEIRNVEEISRTIQGLNRQIENRQTTLARIRREKESRMGDFDNQIRREGDELARLEGQMVDMKKQLI
jgi:hypothetical protein